MTHDVFARRGYCESKDRWDLVNEYGGASSGHIFFLFEMIYNAKIRLKFLRMM